jgi:hypothetical protein
MEGGAVGHNIEKGPAITGSWEPLVLFLTFFFIERLQDEMDRAVAIDRGENPPPLPPDPSRKPPFSYPVIEKFI